MKLVIATQTPRETDLPDECVTQRYRVKSTDSRTVLHVQGVEGFETRKDGGVAVMLEAFPGDTFKVPGADAVAAHEAE